MLQWMGGSRRKVNASRKPMHNKQRQYFEQRKRQLQAYGQENHTDVSKQVHHHEESRSLDILSLENLATTPHQGYSSLANASEPGPLMQKFSTATASAYTPDVCVGKLDKLKMPIPSSEHTESKDLKENYQSEVLVLDLLIDDGDESEPKARLVPEDHVAFSVEGLGKIGMETPAHSPKLHKRELPLPPRNSGHAHSSTNFKNFPYDCGIELNAVLRDVNMKIAASEAELYDNSSSCANRTRKIKSMKLDDPYASPDVFVDQWDYLSHDKEDTYIDGKSRKQEYADYGFAATKNDMLWGSDSFNSVDYPFISSNSTAFGIWESSFPDECLQKSRTAKARRRFDNSAHSNAFSSLPLLEKEDNFISFNWKRDKATNLRSNGKSMIYPPSCDSSESEGSQERTSLLSEESCSSTAVRGERSSDLQFDSAKSRGSKKNQKDEIQITLDKMDDSDKLFADEKFYADFIGPFSKRNLEGEGNFNRSKYSSSKASCYSESLSTLKNFGPDCLSPIKEDVTSANMASAPSFCFTNSRDTKSISSRCNMLPEENAFNLFSVPKLVSSADFMQADPKSNFTADWIPCSSDASIRLSGLSSQLQKLQDDIQMPDLPGLPTHKHKNEEYGCPKEPQNKVSPNSPNDIADCNESPSEHVGSNNETEELCEGSRARNCLEKVDCPKALVEVSTQPNSSVGDEEQDQSHGIISHLTSELNKKESVKENLGTEENVGQMMDGKRSNVSYQVMLESYVLRLLSVQKVLL